MIKKLSVFGILLFLGLFFYFYKTSGRFRKSINSALLGTIVILAYSLESLEKDVNAFSPQQQSHQNSPSHHSGLFNCRLSNNGSGSEKPNDDGSNGNGNIGPNYPKLKSVEETERRLTHIQAQIVSLEEMSDSEEDECKAVPEKVSKKVRKSDLSINLTAYDGFEAKLSDRSENHLTSKHGHEFDIDDPLPFDLNQKPTKYKQTRTRINKKNKAKLREKIKSILLNPKSDIYTNVSIRGIQSRVYHCKDTNRVVAIHTEGEFAGQIMKAQPIVDIQLEFLREFNVLD